MKCKECLRKLSVYQDNELSLEKSNLVKQHLEFCNECKLEYKNLTSLKKQYDNILPIVPSKNLTINIMEQIKAPPSTNTSKLVNGLLYGFLLVIMVSFVFLFQTSIPNLTQESESFFEQDQSLISMVINKENTSIIALSEEICQSIIPEGVQNGK